MFHCAGGFIHSVARRTREHTKCVPSRRSRSPFCEPGGRGRTPHPFCGFPHSAAFFACESAAQSKKVRWSRTHSVFHRGHKVSLVAPELFSVLWYSGRESTQSVFHRASHVLRSVSRADARGRLIRSVVFPVPRFSDLISAPRGLRSVSLANAGGRACRSAWRLIARCKFSVDF